MGFFTRFFLIPFYVDEYQDCSNIQHVLISSLADILPCRILGDPLQAIFDFADHPVDWDTSVYPEFIYRGAALLNELNHR